MNAAGTLVIKRRAGEAVVIDGDIVVTVAHTASGRVTLHFNAPEDVEIWRQELVDPATGFPPEDSHVPG